MATPIIVPIPIQHTRTVECVLFEGRKFCESTSMSQKDFGIAAIAIILWATMMMASFSWASNDHDHNGWKFIIPLVVLLAPFILMALL